MPQDAITLRLQAKALDTYLSGAKVNRITQPTADEIVLTLYSSYGTAKIVASANARSARVGFTKLERKNPQNAPSFCMLLRKHLTNATVKHIQTLGTERIILITFEGKNDFMESVEKQLYCEIMGKYSNIVLCENNVISGTIKPAVVDLSKDRVLLVGAVYKLPKSQEKTDVFDHESSIQVLSNFNGGDLGDFVFSNFQGFSSPTSKEVVTAFYGKSLFENKLIKTQEFYDFMRNFVDNYASEPNIVYSQGKPLDYYFCNYKTVSGEKVFYDCITDAECAYFDLKQQQRDFEELYNKLASSLRAHTKKENKKLQIIEDKELECADSEMLRIKGELITANIYRMKQGDKILETQNYYDEQYPTIKIQLDSLLSPVKNAQKYFKRYTKMKNTLTAIAPQKEQILQELDYCESVSSELFTATTVEDLLEISDELTQSGILKDQSNANKNTKKKKPTIEFRVYQYKGYTIRAGKNNIQNDKLTFSSRPSDLWLHAKDYHSAHVVIESKGGHIPDEIINIAAEICAFYSEGKKGGKVPVDYTLKKYVKKPPKAKFGSVIYTDFKTCLVEANSHKNLEL